MLLIQLGKHAVDCRVELDGQDISSRLCGIEVVAHVGIAPTLVKLLLVDDVTIIGEAGTLEFITRRDPE